MERMIKILPSKILIQTEIEAIVETMFLEETEG